MPNIVSTSSTLHYTAQSDGLNGLCIVSCLVFKRCFFSSFFSGDILSDSAPEGMFTDLAVESFVLVFCCGRLPCPCLVPASQSLKSSLAACIQDSTSVYTLIQKLLPL